MSDSHQRISVKELAHRIDANFYRADFVHNEQRLLKSGLNCVIFRDLIEKGRRAVYFSTETLERSEAPEDWVPFLTADDLGANGFFVDFNARRFVSPGFAERYPNGLIRENELLVKVKGPNQITAYCDVTPNHPVLVSGTLWGGLVRKTKVDPHYLVAALSSPYATKARTRLRTNLNVEFLSPVDLLGLRLPVAELAQTYIGDLVRRSALLRRFVENIDKKVIASFDFLTNNLASSERSTRVGSASVDCHRLNPSHYDTCALAAIKNAQQLPGVETLGTIAANQEISGGATPRGAAYASKGIFFARVQNVRAFRLDLSDAVYINDDEDALLGRSRCRSGDVVLTITGYPGSASVVFDDDLPLNINQHSVRFTPTEDWPAGFVAAAINSKFGKLQVNRLAIGGTRDALDYPSVRSLLIPRFAKRLRIEIHEQVVSAYKASRFSDKCLATAMHLIEALIDRVISEQEIMEARIGLEQGDQVADRKLLARIYTGGVDAVETRHLFPDLDAYYHTIGLAEKSLAEEVPNDN